MVHQFKAAPCSESRCNMLSVMLDHVAWNLSEVRPALQKQAVVALCAGPTSAVQLLISASAHDTCWQKLIAGTLWTSKCMSTSM